MPKNKELQEKLKKVNEKIRKHPEQVVCSLSLKRCWGFVTGKGAISTRSKA